MRNPVRFIFQVLIAPALLWPHAAQSALNADPDRAVIVLSVDGLAAFYWERPTGSHADHSRAR